MYVVAVMNDNPVSFVPANWHGDGLTLSCNSFR